MKQKTAIRQLIEYFEEQSKLNNIVHTGLIMALTKARQLEPVNEQQIKDAYDAGESRQLEASSYFYQTFER